jgi:hypothetical protein
MKEQHELIYTFTTTLMQKLENGLLKLVEKKRSGLFHQPLVWGFPTLALPFRVTNLKTAPEQPLVTELKLEAEFVP